MMGPWGPLKVFGPGLMAGGGRAPRDRVSGSQPQAWFYQCPKPLTSLPGLRFTYWHVGLLSLWNQNVPSAFVLYGPDGFCRGSPWRPVTWDTGFSGSLDCAGAHGGPSRPCIPL